MLSVGVESLGSGMVFYNVVGVGKQCSAVFREVQISSEAVGVELSQTPGRRNTVSKQTHGGGEKWKMICRSGTGMTW